MCASVSAHTSITLNMGLCQGVRDSIVHSTVYIVQDYVSSSMEKHEMVKAKTPCNRQNNTAAGAAKRQPYDTVGY